MLAAGGDPHRDVDPQSRVVCSLAAELDDPERRAELVRSLEELAAGAAGLPLVQQALERLRADPEAAWRWLATALLADELSSD